MDIKTLSSANCGIVSGLNRSFLKFLYRSLPYKHRLFRLIRPLNFHESIWQHLHFTGPIEVQLRENVSLVLEHRGSISENQLFWAGIERWYERTSIKLWMRLVENATVIVDVGANSGVYALVAQALSPKSKVLAFEPIPATYQWLKRNIELNGFSALVTEQIALSSSSGEAQIWLDSPGSHYGPSLYQAGEKSIDEGVRLTVKTQALDDYLTLNKVDRLDLLKIDVERHEPQVLQGMRFSLARFKPTLLLEVLDDRVGAEVQRELCGLGYMYFNIDEVSGALEETENICKSSTMNYLILQPRVAASIGLI